MSVNDAVRLLRIYLEEGPEGLRTRFGSDAIAVAEDIEQLMEEQVGEDTTYVSLWDAFQRNPGANTAELIGALEAMIESDPVLARRLDRFLEEYYAAMQETADVGDETPDLETTEAAEISFTDLEDTEVRDSYLTEPDTTERTDALQRPESPETREPYYPDTATLIEHETVAGEGTYLYGNVKGSNEPVGRSIGVDTFDFGEEIIDVELENISGLPGFLDAILRSMDEAPDVEGEQRQQIEEEIAALRQQIGQGDAADPQTITEHFRKLRNVAPNVAEALLQALETLDLASPVQEAVANARSDSS